TESSIINGINWAVDPDGNSQTDDGADIINMSLGGAYADLNSPIVYAIKDAIDAGVLVVVASGNCGSGCPSGSCNGYIGIETPGISPKAITVGAVDKQNNWACFSSGGIINEIIKPDIVAPGVNINSSVPEGYSAFSGTSMATPHVAGAAALLLQSNENLTPKEVKYILEATAQKLGEPGKDTKYGSGLIDAGKFIPPNVNKLLKYKVELSELVYLYDELIINLIPLAGSIESASAVIKDPNNIEYEIEITNVSGSEWKGIFSNTDMVGVYSVDIFITDKVGNITEFNENFGVIRYDSNSAFIEQIMVSNEIPYDENFSVTVVFKNNGGSSINTIIEVQVIEEDILLNALEKNITALPQSENYIDFLVEPIGVLGAKKILAVSSFEGEYHTKEKSFMVTDVTEPGISSVNFESIIYKNQPAVIELIIEEISDVNGNLFLTDSLNETTIIPLKSVWEIGTQKKLTGTYYGTDLTGENEFYLEVCDSAGFCTSSINYEINVRDCNNEHVLIVLERESAKPERFLPFLENYCVSLLNTHESSLPDNAVFFDNFELIIWLTGTTFKENISDKAAVLLLDSNTNIVLEGEDIAFKHFSDEFMVKVANSIFKEELELEDYNAGVQLQVTTNHPLFNSMGNILDYNLTFFPYPDALTIVNNGIELALWDLNENTGSAIVASNTDKKTLFLPFSMKALENKQETFIQNIINWMLTEENESDLITEIIDVYPAIEGNNTINFKIINQGLKDANNVKIDLYVDDFLETTQFTDIESSSFIELEEEIQLSAGTQEIKIYVNPDFQVTETNYLNNINLVQIDVLPEKADLTVKSIKGIIIANTIIETEIENIGGSNAENVQVQIYYNETKIYDENIDINSRETKTVQTNIEKEPGIHIIETKINPQEIILEADYNNNTLTQELYVCSKENILIVNDNDAENNTTNNPDNTNTFEEILKNNGYCFETWNEKIQGTPNISHLNKFNILIWSTGNYWNTVIDTNDMILLEQYQKPVLFEGADIAFDHSNETFLE
ncbi:S8 family serine peptidase, partial [Candidatus Micrarchaeota archaeon]|nr:S8 family serine peptidase [Candidatus Micrarchaeota archaeon]